MLRNLVKIYYCGMSDTATCLSLIFIVCLCQFSITIPARATVEWSGNLSPADPTAWTDYSQWGGTEGVVGVTGTGFLEVNGDSDLSSDSGHIGYCYLSSGKVMVDGTGSTWTNTDVLVVGEGGNGSLAITGGGMVSNLEGLIGEQPESTGMVRVNGTGSTWSNTGQVHVGIYGNGTLDITGGGSVVSGGRVYIGRESSSIGLITVDGVGSTLMNSNYLFVGYEGDGILNITDGMVSNTSGYIGDQPDSTGIVSVTGPDSIWTNNEYLTVGGLGNGTLNITNGGTVNTQKSGFIGSWACSTGEVTVDGIGSTWTNNDSLYVGQYGNGTLNITKGGEVNIASDTRVSGYSGATGLINMDNGTLTSGALFCGADDLAGTGTINTHGLVSDVNLVIDSVHGLKQTFNINKNPDQNITVNLDANGLHAMGAGYRGLGTMDVSDGIVLKSREGYIGYHSGSTGEVAINGTDSKWINNYNLYVGREGNGNLNITDAGEVHVTYNTWVAQFAGSSGTIHFDNGTLTTESLFCNSANLTGIGTINTHGLVCDIDLVFDASHGLSQTLTIDTIPHQQITLNLTPKDDYYPYLGAGFGQVGTIGICDGRVVESANGYIGYKSGSTGEITIAGAGSTWTIGPFLYVGKEGNGTLNITDGGLVSNTYGYIGSTASSTGTVNVDGAGSKWMNSQSFLVGGSSNINGGKGTLNITDGGAVSNIDAYVGYQSGSIGQVNVDGNGSIWTNSGNVYLGHEGDGAHGTLTITNGGTVRCRDFYICRMSGVTGVLMVSGTGSKLINNGNLYIGRLEVFNHSNPSTSGTINVTDGGEIINNYASIGNKAESTGQVTVSGLGSTWTNRDGLFVGSGGRGTLDITYGGTVKSSYSKIAGAANSTGEVKVDGIGSTWRIDNYLSLGAYSYKGQGIGKLHVLNGGVVKNTYCLINYSSEATVDGTGSKWTNQGFLQVKGTLNITNGGLVSIADYLEISGWNARLKMAGGGRLALRGEADDLLLDFLGLVDGTDAIRYWDDSISDWADITDATYGEDYTLSCPTEGDLVGYTVLTVGVVPEPSTLIGLLGLCLAGLLTSLRRNRQS